MPERETTSAAETDEKTRRLWWLRGACFLQLVAMGTIFSFETVWMREHGLGETLIGVLLAVATALVLVAGIGWGLLADRTGRPAWIVAGGCLSMAGALFLLAHCREPAHFAAYAVLRGISYPMIWNIMPLLALSVLAGRAAGRGYGSYRIFGSMGYILATLVLPRLLPDIGTLLMLAAGAMLLAYLPLRAGRFPVQRRREHGGWRELLTNHELLGLFAAAFFFAMANPAIYAFLPVYARRLGADVKFIGLLLAFNGIIGLVAMPVCGRIVDRFGPRRMLWLAFLAQPLRLAVYSLVSDYRWLIAPQALHFFTWAGLEVSAVLFITRLAGEGRSATAMSGYMGMHVLGSIVGVSLTGLVAENLGYGVMFRGSALCSTLGLLVFTVVLLHLRRRDRTAPSAAAATES